MSRELLKRALDFLTDADYEVGINWDRDKYVALINNIETYLAQPEPEPVGYVSPSSARVMAHDGAWDSLQIYSERFSDADVAMYLSPPDQSARVAELLAANRILHGELAECQGELAALQAKREPLSRDEIIHIFNIADASTVSADAFAFEFAKAIEAAHGIKP